MKLRNHPPESEQSVASWGCDPIPRKDVNISQEFASRKSYSFVFRFLDQDFWHQVLSWVEFSKSTSLRTSPWIAALDLTNQTPIFNTKIYSTSLGAKRTYSGPKSLNPSTQTAGWIWTSWIGQGHKRLEVVKLSIWSPAFSILSCTKRTSPGKLQIPNHPLHVALIRTISFTFKVWFPQKQIF